MLSESQSKFLIKYCPKVEPIIHYRTSVYGALTDRERDVLIMGAVMEAIEEKGEWGEFLIFCASLSEGYFQNYFTDERGYFYGFRFIQWLIDPSRLPELVCAWKGVE